MAISKRFVIRKNETNDEISYIEYEKVDGFSIKPKSTFNTDNMINVEKMVIISPSLIEKLVNKKCKRTLEKIIKLTSLSYDSEDDDDSSGKIGFVLNEIEKFQQILDSKYKEYMKEKDIKILKKKLEIISSELKLREFSLTNKHKLEEKKSKGR